MKIRRLLGIDKQGLLSIGVTNKMETRRRQFLAGMSGGANHSEGALFYLLKKHARLDRKIGFDDVEYCFEAFTKRTDAAKREEYLIKRYVKQFGEVPPLNSSIPGRKNERW